MQSSDQAALLAHPQVAGASPDEQEEEAGFGKVSGPSSQRGRFFLFVCFYVILNETHKWKSRSTGFPFAVAT